MVIAYHINYKFELFNFVIPLRVCRTKSRNLCVKYSIFVHRFAVYILQHVKRCSLYYVTKLFFFSRTSNRRVNLLLKYDV